MCYYDDMGGDGGFYDEFGNPIDPSQMDDYMMYGDPQFAEDYGTTDTTDYYQQPQDDYYQQQAPQQQAPQQQPTETTDYYYIEPQYQQPQEDYYLEDEIGNRSHIKGGKNFRDYMNRKYN